MLTLSVKTFCIPSTVLVKVIDPHNANIELAASSSRWLNISGKSSCIECTYLAGENWTTLVPN